MAHIVFVIGKLVSLQNAVVEMAHRLEDARHHVTIASMEDIGTRISGQGLTFQRLSPMGSVNEGGARLSKWRRIRTRQATELAAWDMDSKIKVLEALQPDLIVVETELPALVIGLSQLRVPMATIAYFASIYKRPLVPPLHMAIMPADGWRGTRLGIEWSWLRYRLRLLRDELRRFLRHGGLYQISMLRYYARQVGFDFRRGASTYEWLIPVTFEAFPMLYPVPLEFDFPHEPHSHVHHLGIMINTRAGSDDVGDDRQAQLEALLAHHATADHPHKLLYCAFGTAFSGDDSDFIKRIITAVGDQPNWTMILSLGKRDITNLAPLPVNVHVFNWVPQWRVLSHVDVAIVHAGLATCLECIHYGVPMLSYPFNVNDQLGNATRVRYHNIGIVGERETDRPEVIRAHIHQLLSDNQIHDSLNRLRQSVQRYTPQQTVDLFERLIQAQ